MAEAEADDDVINPRAYALGDAEDEYMDTGEDGGSSSLTRTRSRSYDNALNTPMDEE